MLFRTTVNITRISIGNMDFAYGFTTFEIVIDEPCEKHSSIAFHSLAQFLVATVERDGSWFLYLELHIKLCIIPDSLSKIGFGISTPVLDSLQLSHNQEHPW